MKMNWKRWTAWALVSLFAAGALFAGGGAEDEEAGPKQDVTPEGVFPIVDEKITMTAFLPASGSLGASVEDYQDNDFIRYLEEKTNIFLELETAPSGEAEQKRNLLLASNDYPEIFISEFSGFEYQFYGSQGVFLPLNDLIDRYGVNVPKVFTDYPLVKANLAMADGSIYALPDINDCFHCAYAQKMWIYRPWLEKLGLEMPATTEEFKEVPTATVSKTKFPSRGQSPAGSPEWTDFL